jgi:hypothetical protein
MMTASHSRSHRLCLQAKRSTKTNQRARGATFQGLTPLDLYHQAQMDSTGRKKVTVTSRVSEDSDSFGLLSANSQGVGYLGRSLPCAAPPAVAHLYRMDS